MHCPVHLQNAISTAVIGDNLLTWLAFMIGSPTTLIRVILFYWKPANKSIERMKESWKYRQRRPNNGRFRILHDISSFISV